MKSFKRIGSVASYRKNLFFVTEGETTEKAYLKIVWNRLGLREGFTPRFCHEKSSIPSMLETARKAERNSIFNAAKGDEIWIILDHDEQCHIPSQFRELAAWENAKPYRHVALSTPRFEFWLLMHVDEKPSKERCMSDDYMQQRIPHFKNLPIHSKIFSKDSILSAMKRANAGRIPTCEHASVVGSGFGRLIERLLWRGE